MEQNYSLQETGGCDLLFLFNKTGKIGLVKKTSLNQLVMKTISIFLVILFVSLQSFGQNQPLSKEDYLQKSKNQKTTGWILLAGGTTMAVVGAIIANESYNSEWSLENDSPWFGSNFDTGAYLFLGGAAAGLASIPFFIGSAKNARKAANISFNYQKAYFPQHNTFTAKAQPAITIRIPF